MSDTKRAGGDVRTIPVEEASRPVLTMVERLAAV